MVIFFGAMSLSTLPEALLPSVVVQKPLFERIHGDPGCDYHFVKFGWGEGGVRGIIPAREFHSFVIQKQMLTHLSTSILDKTLDE